MVTLSHAGYVKWQPTDDYAAQKRGGVGKAATRVKDEDFVDNLFYCQYPRHYFVFLQPG